MSMPSLEFKEPYEHSFGVGLYVLIFSIFLGAYHKPMHVDPNKQSYRNCILGLVFFLFFLFQKPGQKGAITGA